MCLYIYLRLSGRGRKQIKTLLHRIKDGNGYLLTRAKAVAEGVTQDDCS